MELGAARTPARMTGPGFELRRAVVADAPALAALAEHCFRDTYAQFNTVQNMELHCRVSYGAALQRAEIERSGMVTWLAVAQGKLIGFCQLNVLRANPSVQAQRPIEIYRLYVRREWHGARVGRALVQRAIETARELGCDAVWLGVWERNPKAVAFYERMGFVDVGEQIFQLGDDAQRDHVMQLRP